ncbi:MAG: hypothetical protein KAH96_05335 [Alphaproteobacteria bacterium]|nr:hypothetical protein [Alphaproteobacteria bacterium]
MAKNDSQKKCIFITSVGRTGTRFIGKIFGTVIPDSISFHEPDLLTPRHVNEWLWKLKAFGPLNMIFGKMLGIVGMRHLSHKRMSGKLRASDVIELIIKQRRKFISSFEQSIYIESNCTFYGIFDLLIEAFTNSNSIFIVRDPRTWVRSRIDWGDWYSKLDYNKLLNLGRLSPYMFENENNSNLWPSYSQFQKLCWAWNKITSFALSRISSEARLKIFKYEDLFLSNNRYEHMNNLLESITIFPDGDKYHYKLRPGILDKVVHASKKNFPLWVEWTHKLAHQLDMICGETMRKFDYGEEREWKAKLLL